jgi:hypothetical protein
MILLDRPRAEIAALLAPRQDIAHLITGMKHTENQTYSVYTERHGNNTVHSYPKETV